MSPVTRGFFGRRSVPEGLEGRIPPGQYVEGRFPVMTAGPTPKVEPADWRFQVTGLVGHEPEWTLAQLQELASAEGDRDTYAGDIHCVTKWSKFDQTFKGISLDPLLEAAQVDERASHVVAHCYGGYTTNLPLEHVTGGKAWLVWEHDGAPLPRDHGGPVRLLVPHLYLWKSAKWIRELRLLDHDEPGFWEVNGYHALGDPWREQRFWGD